MPCTVHDKQIRFHDDDKHYFNFHESRPYTLYGARQTKFDFHDARQSKIADNAARRNPIAPSIYNVRRKEWRVLWMTKVFTSANLTSFLFWKDWDARRSLCFVCSEGCMVLSIRKVYFLYTMRACFEKGNCYNLMLCANHWQNAWSEDQAISRHIVIVASDNTYIFIKIA